MKVTIIGSGSTYTPELINGFIKRKDQLPVDAFYLMDIDVKKNAIVSGLVKRMLLEAGVTAKLVITNDLDEAIEGAAYVLTQVRIGNLDARILDESIPLKYGLLGQETTGVGGLMKAMRTIPFIMKVCQKMKTLAPDAWLINFTNPSGLVTEAIVNYMDVKMVGLCNGPINMVRQIKQIVPKEVQVFDYNFVGLNHLCWIVNVYADQKDILPKLMEGGLDIPGMSNVPQASYSEDLLKATKGIPISYLNYYYYRDQQVEKCQKAEKSRGEICQGIEEDLLKLYQDETLNTCPEILNQRGGSLYSEAAVSVIDAIENDLNEIHVVDTKNQGAYAFMDTDDVVEVKCRINKDGATPIELKNFDNPYIVGLMQSVKAYEKLAAKAAIHGDYHEALAALMVHPLIGDYHKAKQALDEMLIANKAYLPQFFKKESI